MSPPSIPIYMNGGDIMVFNRRNIGLLEDQAITEEPEDTVTIQEEVVTEESAAIQEETEETVAVQEEVVTEESAAIQEETEETVAVQEEVVTEDTPVVTDEEPKRRGRKKKEEVVPEENVGDA